MPELRWILLAIGAVVVVGVYLWSRRREDQDEEPLSPARREPVLGEAPAPWETMHPESERPPARRPGAQADGDDVVAEANSAEPEAATAEGEQLIIVLRVRARPEQSFQGAALAEAFAQEGLEHGQLGAFHSLGPDGRSRFMVANLTEPGSFDPDGMADQEIPGVSLFMVLPGPADPPATLDAMLGVARRLARRFNGELLDENGSTLTVQEAAYLREKVVEYWRRVRLAGGGVGRTGDLL
ncbi:MAG: cell division protein ZipA C-terminal FtsZ-binding domain-containing protein [Gammaproteobacteria bacterium]